jgi:hypothetical protein
MAEKETIEQKGVYGKYRITKADGSSCDPEACYFVLRLDEDAAARKAVLVYAEECDNLKLAEDIRECVEWLNNPPACICGGRDWDIICPFHNSFYNPVWRYGQAMATKEEEIQAVLVGMSGALMGAKMALRHGGEVQMETIEQFQADVNKLKESLGTAGWGTNTYYAFLEELKDDISNIYDEATDTSPPEVYGALLGLTEKIGKFLAGDYVPADLRARERPE